MKEYATSESHLFCLSTLVMSSKSQILRRSLSCMTCSACSALSSMFIARLQMFFPLPICLNERLCFQKGQVNACGGSTMFTRLKVIPQLIQIQQQRYFLKMRSLSVKQQPNVKFTFQSSPTNSPTKNQFFQNPIPKPGTQPQFNIVPVPTYSITTSKPVNFTTDSHIKIVQPQFNDDRRQRRRKIFEQVGTINRSRSKQRNKSYSIFNGLANQNTTKVRDISFTKESGKEQEAQTDSHLFPRPESSQKISKFMQSAEKVEIPMQNRSLRFQLPPQEPLQLQKVHFSQNISHQSHDSKAQQLQKQLQSREKELAFLKMELQRFERCEKLTNQNQTIYKRLVEKLAILNSQRSSSHKRPPVFVQTKAQSPTRHNRIGQNSQTTRFQYPNTQRRQSARRQANSSLSKLQNAIEEFQLRQAVTQEAKPISAVTFCNHPKVVRNPARNPSSLLYNQDLNRRLEESVRRYTSNIDYDDFSLKDKLSEINRHLQTKYTIRNELIANRLQNSRYSSYSNRHGQRAISAKLPYYQLLKYQ